jgi:2-haloacid dehalogenase
MTMHLSEFDAVTFDVYRIPIGWEPSTITFLQLRAERRDILVPDRDLLFMAFDFARSEFSEGTPCAYLPGDSEFQSFTN